MVKIIKFEKIEFFWYLRKISWLALIGYIAGIVVYLAEENILNF